MIGAAMALKFSQDDVAKVLSTHPKEYFFGTEQTRVQRAIMMSKVLPDALLVAKRIVLELVGSEERDRRDPQPLGYYMACWDEKDEVGDDYDVRCQARYWTMRVFCNGRHGFCDFNGNPGDNQYGMGVIWDCETMQTQTVFHNHDELISWTDVAYRDAVRWYALRRGSVPENCPEDFDGEGDEGDGESLSADPVEDESQGGFANEYQDLDELQASDDETGA